jgi:hypothetical protein
MSEGFCFAAFFHVVTLRIFPIRVFSVLFSFVIFVLSLQTHTHMQGNNKNSEGKQHTNKTQMENMQSVTM